MEYHVIPTLFKGFRTSDLEAYQCLQGPKFFSTSLPCPAQNRLFPRLEVNQLQQFLALYVVTNI